MIPASNVSNLMLKQEIVDAVQADKFHIWSVASIEEGIQVLTGIPSGKNGDSGFAPEGIFARVDNRLAKMAEELAKYSGEN